MSETLWGISPIRAVENCLWVPPHNSPAVGPIPYWENPTLHGSRALVSPEVSIASALTAWLNARVLSNIYERTTWVNSGFDYNEINLSGWPAITQVDSKRRNEFRKATERARARPLVINEMDPNDWIGALPSLANDDSVLLSFLPQLRAEMERALDLDNGGPMRFRTIVYSFEEQPVALGMIEVIEATGIDDVRTKVMFNYCLVRLAAEFTATDITWALCDLAAREGCTNFDCWNLAFTAREGYKRTFFTGPMQGYCWTQGLEDTPWIHAL